MLRGTSNEKIFNKLGLFKIDASLESYLVYTKLSVTSPQVIYS